MCERAAQRPRRTPWWSLVLLLACGENAPPADREAPPAAPTEPPSVSTLAPPPADDSATTGEAPADTREAPVDTREAPADTRESPADTREAPPVVTIPAPRGPLRFDSVGGMTADGVLPMPEGPCLLREEELLACWRADEQDFVEVPRGRYAIAHTELAIEEGVVVVGEGPRARAAPPHATSASARTNGIGRRRRLCTNSSRGGRALRLSSQRSQMASPEVTAFPHVTSSRRPSDGMLAGRLSPRA